MTDESPLEHLFPRLVTQVVSFWGYQEFERFALDLIIDKRGDRHGLPPEVLYDVMFLYDLHVDMFKRDRPDIYDSNSPIPHVPYGKGR